MAFPERIHMRRSTKEAKEQEEKVSAGHRILTVIGAVLCIVLIPILVVNCTLILKSFTNKDQVPSIGGIFPMIILTDSMEPEFSSGDLIVCHTIDAENVKEGDIICFYDAENVSSVKFTDFKVMGGTDVFHSETQTDNIPDNETFLLSVDFSEASAETVSDQNVTFKLIPPKNAGDTVTMGEVTYGLTSASLGTVSVSDKNVEVKVPEDADRLTGQTLFMKAVIRRTDSSETAETIPYNVTAKWGDTTGTWISRDTILFEIGQYGPSDDLKKSGEYSFTGLENGTYEISWSLVYGKKADENICGNVVSNIADSSYPENHTDPSLKVTTDATSRVIASGTGANLAFEYKSTSENVSVTVAKQGSLCTFGQPRDENISVYNNKTNHRADISFGKDVAPGTYRICFSMDAQSTADDVYFVFIVE